MLPLMFSDMIAVESAEKFAATFVVPMATAKPFDEACDHSQDEMEAGSVKTPPPFDAQPIAPPSFSHS